MTGKRGPGRGRRSPGPIVRRGTLRVSPDVVRKVRLGHPWIYREAVDRRRIEHERAGNEIELVDNNGEFVARGLFDGDTAIVVRVFTRRPGRNFGPELIADRLAVAIAHRKRFFDFETHECVRLLNAESDGIPATVVERYGDYLVVQLFSSATSRFSKALYDALEEQLSPAGIYEQRRFKSLGGEAPRGGAELVRGKAAPVEFAVREGELKFLVDCSAPLSTGLFADLRLGRKMVAGYAKDRRVLNLFSYTGSISVYAAHGGAKEVVAVDVAAKAHARARRNFAANNLDPEKPELIAGDAFGILEKFKQRKREFDLIVIDPPAFASAPQGGKAWSAVKDYRELVGACLEITSPGGLLIAASSTHKLNQADFDLALADGAMRAKTDLRIIERAGLPADFPVLAGFPDGNYLKTAVCIRD